ncbi:HNH endonuclease [Azotobacter vinelandii]|uniref:HNH endonuclease n=1 Tax=Azotobacter vinelandii TaxID=354 RepID=UPI0012E7C923|nr:HNH endonuclease [Azotobacter vinelandii]
MEDVFARNPPVTSTNAKRRRRRIARLRERDGDHCFYCLKPMRRTQMTLEHLLARNLGGSSALTNMVLAHARCNERAGHLSVSEKIRIREQNLMKLILKSREDDLLVLLQALRILN